jgi:hypothetical protein
LDNKSLDNNIIINPNTSGYSDRKMAKWQGLILSEHNEFTAEKSKSSKKINFKKDKQEEEQVYELIDYSYSQKKVVVVQVDCLFNGKYEDDIVGVVCGYFHEHIYLQKENSEVVVCDIGLIRHIEVEKTIKWYKK